MRPIIQATMLAVFMTFAFGLSLVACGGSDEAERVSARPLAPAPAAPAEAPAAPAAATAQAVPETAIAQQRAVPQPAAARAPAPAPAVPVPASASAVGGFAIPSQSQIQAQYASLQRIVVRTARIHLTVDDIQPTIDLIAEESSRLGGWVVSNERHSKHSGAISIRVPSDALGEAITWLRSIAVEVKSESTDSQDVTDEYVDLRSRLDNMMATETRLLEFLELAQDARQALEVQQDLSQLQQEVEQVKGRIKLLEETSAFSLISVDLTLSAMTMPADAGPDKTAAAGANVRFRATFSPPPDIDQYEVVWDFGDGEDVRITSRTAPTGVEGERVTATVVHRYRDPADSPFIVSVKIRGTGDGGVAESEDTLIVSVSEVPTIQVFTGDEDITVDQTEEVELVGSFTRPKGLENVRFKWEFGDGSEPVTGDLPEGITRAAATHVYPDYRRSVYVATLTVTADSEVGEVEGVSEVGVRVQPELGFVVGGYEFGTNFKTAVRALTGFLQGLSVVLIWLAIFSPFWGAAIALLWLLLRWNSRRRGARSGQTADPMSASSAPTTEQAD